MEWTGSKKKVLAVLGLGAIAVGAAYSGNLTGNDEVTYLTAPAEKGSLVTSINATGTARAVFSIKVGSQLSGQVVELFADFNDTVKQGQPIAQLDQRTYAAKVREAEAAIEIAEAGVLIKQAAVEKAKADIPKTIAARSAAEQRAVGALARFQKLDRDLDRKMPLHERGAVSVSTLDLARAERDSGDAAFRAAQAEIAGLNAEVASAQAALRVAESELANAIAVVKQREAALEQAQVELERTVIRAPIDGLIIGRDIDRGQTVAASLEAPTLFEIANDLGEMEVHAKIDEADIGHVRLDQRVTFTVDSFPGRQFSGKVIQIRSAPKTIQNVVIYTVVISAANPGRVLLPGMTASVRIVVHETVNVLKVPNAALRFRPAGIVTSSSAQLRPDNATQGMPVTLWVLDSKGSPTPVQVRIGESDRRATEIVSGSISPGQSVIVGASAAAKGPSLFGLRLNF
jgi:HlyD family secretion protein